jgi:hypothetical protein
MAKPCLPESVSRSRRDCRRRLPGATAAWGPEEERDLMANRIQAGTMMVHHFAVLESRELESEPYSQNWRSMGTLESSGLNRKVQDTGMEPVLYGRAKSGPWCPPGEDRAPCRPGIMRLPAQTRLQHFNCLEVHEVRKLHFLGIPYIFYNGPPSPPAERHPDSVEPAAHPGRRNDSLNDLMVGRSHQFCRRQESLRVTPGNGSVTDRSHLEFE